MADREQQPSRAEQRMQAVAKLKRAASLPRMKDGRRPPMHVEAVSEGEKDQTEEEKRDDSVSPQPEAEEQEEPQEKALEPEEPEVEPEGTLSPGPSARARRRSRSRSRSRTSKDLKGKARGTQSPTPSPLNPGDSSQDEGPPSLPSLAIPVIPQLISPIPSHFSSFNSRLLRSPTPGSPDPSSFLHSGTSPSTPIPPPTLEALHREALQRGLFRSNSAGSAAAGRRLAMQKLTGGTETYDSSPPPTPPPIPGKLNRNNTVSGGEKSERTAARQFMFNQLKGRITKEVDAEQASGAEDRSAPSPTPAKRRRRRSRRGSQSAAQGVSDSEFVASTSPNTPIVPPTPLPPSRLGDYADLRALSATPNQAFASHTKSTEPVEDEHPPELPPPHDEAEHEKHELTRRRSILIEDEDEEEHYSPQPRQRGLHTPSPPDQFQSHNIILRTPHVSDGPSSSPADSPSGVGVPVYLSQRAPSRTDAFPSSPFTTPLKEKTISDEEEEQIMYPADSYRLRTPYTDAQEMYDREISWIADPVPEIRMVIDDNNDDEMQLNMNGERYHEQEYDEPPLSATSSNGFSPQVYDDTSPRVSSDSKSIMIESETSPDNTQSYVPPSPSSAAALSQSASMTRVSDGSMSPQTYPTRLSIASRIQSQNGEHDWEERVVNIESSKRDETASPSTWEKLKGAFRGNSSGRRSRTNSIVARERRDHTDSSVSRESGASLTSAKTDKGDSVTPQQLSQSIMHSPSASNSMLSLAPYPPSRGGPSPIPTSSTDLTKYQDAKLFPFPGIKKLEEERNNRANAKLISPASSSNPDVTAMTDESHSPINLGVYGNGSTQTGEPRERRLSQQASDSRLTAKYVPETPGSPSDPFTASPSSNQNGGSLNLKLPMTLPGVKQWLRKNMGPSQVSSQASSISISAPILDSNLPNTTKKPSLTDLLWRKDGEWEELGSTPTSTSGDTLLGKKLTTPEEALLPSELPERWQESPSNGERGTYQDTDKTPKGKKTIPPHPVVAAIETVSPNPFFDESPSIPQTISDPILSPTPDPSSSLSDYPAHSTSDSSSGSSSQGSLTQGSQGPVVLERLEESLARGSRSPMWSAAVDDPPRKLILSSPVLQVVNPNTVKDRFLFLFNDILIIAKPIIQDQDNLIDSYKPSPLDRKFIVKSVVHLRNLRFCADRNELQPRTSINVAPPRNPLLKAFVQQFSNNPDQAIEALLTSADLPDESTYLGQLLFKTVDLNRARLADYLCRRLSKSVLKAYLDSFGFLGLRIDKALRVFLHSINVSPKSNALEHLLDSFASRWYEANAKVVAYDKDLAIKLVRSVVQLNEIFHNGITDEPGASNYVRHNLTSRDFIEIFRRYDARGLVPDELLEDVYDSIRMERLSQARSVPAGDQPIVIKRPIPVRLTYKVQSEPVILRIPQADPGFMIQLYGQDLIFDPPILSFAKSSEASFRVVGTALGSKSMIMCRSGINAIQYSGLPLSSTVVVERAFMRNTFQLAFKNHAGLKRRYMFSVDDPLIRHQWVIYLRRQIEHASIPTGSPSSGSPKFYKAAENMAFKVLQETLISPSTSTTSPQGALDRLNGSSRRAHNGNGVSSFRNGGPLSAVQSQSLHVRSKSRSKVYHRHGPGRNELDLSNSTSSRLARESSDDNERSSSSGIPDRDQSSAEGHLWSGRDLEMHCQQSSSIPLVLAFLQVGAPEHGQGAIS